MSATANNSGDWGAPQLVQSEKTAPVPSESGRDALQALLAFACIRGQAARRKRLKESGASSETPDTEEFGLDEVLRLVAARAVSITGADGAAIALAEKDAILCRASAGKIVPDPGIRLDLNSGFSGACLRDGKTVRCDDSETDSRVNAQACCSLGARSMVAVPLSAKGRVIGLIEAFSSETYGFNDSDVRSLNLLGELILAAIRPEEEERLAELAKDVIPEAAHVAETHAKVLVDEKFAPELLPVDVASKPEAKAPASEPVAPVETEVSVAAPGSTPPKEGPSVKGIALTAALLLIAVGLGWAWIWKYHHVEQAISANTQSASRMNPQAPGAVAAAPIKPGATPRITGLRHWSSADSSTVVVDLEDQVQYEAHSIEGPPRVYFDLHDTKPVPGLLNQNINVDDTFVKRIRMAQPSESVTRVVLEIKGAAEISVKLEPNPYRLTIEVHRPGATPTPTNLNKPSPGAALNKPSPEALAPTKKTADLSAAHNSEFRIVLDAGHGGWDLGTVGRKGLLEKDLVLDVVQRLGNLIENKLGAQVIYTRQDDSYLPLEKRAEVANLAKADLFLSVHANYSDLSTARGVETYYTNTYSSIKARTTDDDPTLKDVDWTGVDIRDKVTNSHRFASDVQQALYGGLAARNPDIRDRGVKKAQYVVLTGTLMPAVLAEISFVSSPADEDKLQSAEYRQQIAEALYRGIAKYRDEGRHTKLASAGNQTTSR